MTKEYNFTEVANTKREYLIGLVNRELKNIDLQKYNLTKLRDGVFAYCYYLSDIVLPNSLKVIGSDAFFYCSKLSSITFLGTIEEWNAITLGTDWNKNSSISTIHCEDGDVLL